LDSLEYPPGGDMAMVMASYSLLGEEAGVNVRRWLSE
jgi:hypothetical protein